MGHTSKGAGEQRSQELQTQTDKGVMDNQPDFVVGDKTDVAVPKDSSVVMTQRDPGT